MKKILFIVLLLLCIFLYADNPANIMLGTWEYDIEQMRSNLSEYDTDIPSDEYLAFLSTITEKILPDKIITTVMEEVTVVEYTVITIVAGPYSYVEIEFINWDDEITTNTYIIIDDNHMELITPESAAIRYFLKRIDEGL